MIMIGIEPVSKSEAYDRLMSLPGRVVINSAPASPNRDRDGRLIWTVTYDGPNGPVEASAWTMIGAVYVATGGDLWTPDPA